MENYTPKPNEDENKKVEVNKAGLLKTLGLATSVVLLGGKEVAATNTPDSQDKKTIKMGQVTPENIDHVTNNPNTINFFEAQKSLDATKYFENISDSISPESRKVITEQFVNQILKEITNDNFLDIMKLDWIIYAGDNGLTKMTPLHALAFKEILNKAKKDPKNFKNSGFAPQRIKIIMDKEIKIEMPNGGILPPTMFKKPNGDYYTINEIDRMLKRHPDQLHKLEECSEILDFGFYAPIGEGKVPVGKARNTRNNSRINVPCNCGPEKPEIFK
ncbi:hypothetical protein HXX01_02400 [Candidatus Nomurabacteria bacterium]|nr:hypothetical protein [Candidatus Nomurabacteria bacterium]